MTVQFIRTTHDQNGRWRSFPPDALAFWHLHGAVVGSLLRPEQPQTFARLLTACNDYADERLADGRCPEQNRGYVAWVLVHLLQFGMAATVTTGAPPTPPTSGLNWLAVFPRIALETTASVPAVGGRR